MESSGAFQSLVSNTGTLRQLSLLSVSSIPSCVCAHCLQPVPGELQPLLPLNPNSHPLAFSCLEDSIVVVQFTVRRGGPGKGPHRPQKQPQAGPGYQALSSTWKGGCEL